MKYLWKIRLCLLIPILIGTARPSESAEISGRVMDRQNRPIIAATIAAMQGDSVVAGTFTGTDGSYSISLANAPESEYHLVVSSVGYSSQTLNPDLSSDHSDIIIHLDEKPIDVGLIRVNPQKEIDNSETVLTENRVELMAQRSLVPSNPIAAIRQPQAVRQGSGHSSKIRLNGTNPDYYLNGINIGHDPNHYGMFSILPASVVDAVSLMPQGTEARYRLPTVFALSTKSPFNSGSRATVSLSTVEATATYSYGNHNFFILGSLRKSVLDKLIDNFKMETDKMTIPPTNFQDVYFSSGLRLTPDMELTVDCYQIRDFLSLKTPETGSNSSGIKSAQNMKESYLGSRFKFVSGRALFSARLAAKIGTEQYGALPVKSSEVAGFNVDLRASHTKYIGGLDLTFFFDGIEINGGAEYSAIPDRTIDLDQVNWNFLPPDANSDKPFVYQIELNRAFGSYTLRDSEDKAAIYTSGRLTLGKLNWETGLRGERFGRLRDGQTIAVRNRLGYNFSRRTELEFFMGTFYESPSGKILDPYQVLVRYNLSDLKPIETNLYSLTFRVGPCRLGAFRKEISRFPVVDPDFDAVSKDGSVLKEFFRMTSSGRMSFYGGNIEFDLHRFPLSRSDIYASYGYTRASNTYETVTIPYELNAEHKFYMQTNYSLSHTVSIGTDINLRSGFPYTPFKTIHSIDNADRYNKVYYENSIVTENSESFPTYFSLGLYSEFQLGRLEIHAAISNVTSHDNPIVNTADGYIYDAGILPVVGVKYTF